MEERESVLKTVDKNGAWVEKYRPSDFNDIVLDPINKQMMENMIKTKYFPNLLLYGPPGTGKTTTIINLVKSYQKDYNPSSKKNALNSGLMIHLNASDERGIDIIRNQINQFVNSSSLFNTGTKFVILDEVDYMTKNAQQALKYLLQGFNKNVRFCLICNYISRIDESLQNDFVRLRFNQLPYKEIIGFLSRLSSKENLGLTEESLCSIQQLYKSDIRSMINYIQTNQFMKTTRVINIVIWEEIQNLLMDRDNYKSVGDRLEQISIEYNVDIKNLLKYFFNYIIRYKREYVSRELVQFIEFIVHSVDTKIDFIKIYSIEKLHLFLRNP
jgi:DNA polymerase III delta prime subunit